MLKTIILASCLVAVPFTSALNAALPVAVQATIRVSARTVTTTVKANSSAEAVVIAQKRYPKGKVTGVRKNGSFWIVTLRIE